MSSTACKESEQRSRNDEQEGSPPQHDGGSNSDNIEAAANRTPPQMHLVITNIAKRRNVQALLQTALAMGCASILMVGQKTFDTTIPVPDKKGSSDIPRALHGPLESGTLKLRRFAAWNECVAYLKEQNIELVGVEIHPDAYSLDAFLEEQQKKQQDVAFVMGNEGDGLQTKQMQSCDAFVRISQYGSGTASLNVYVAASIVLHRFHHWQRQSNERTRTTPE